MDEGSRDKKAKGTKKCITERIIKFNEYKKCLLKNEIILNSQLGFKKEGHNVYTTKINKIALSSDDDKRLQTLDNTKSYPYGTSVAKVCKIELLSKYK